MVRIYSKAPPKDMVEGYKHQTKNNGELEVVRYENQHNVIVSFTGFSDEVSTTSERIRKGDVKNFMRTSVLGKGYNGCGEYSCTKNRKPYTLWQGMITRCYCTILHKRRPSYAECSVTPEWLNFQNFAKWFYEESNYEIGLHLDKDLRVQDNKVYGPDTCMFVTNEVNSSLLNNNASRGKCMVGVRKFYRDERYVASISDGAKKNTHIGLYEREEDAHEAYKAVKYEKIRELANRQKDELVKQGLLNWVIHKY